MQQPDNAWSWSESFTAIVDTLMREPPSEGPTPWDWSQHRERLACWRRQVDGARELYREGHEEALRVLYDYWQTITDDLPEQVRFASETYHQFQLPASA